MPYEENPLPGQEPGLFGRQRQIGESEYSSINPDAMRQAEEASKGETPSVADSMLRGTFGRGMAAARAQQATGRGNAYLAQLGAQRGIGDMTSRIAPEAATMRAGEMAAAREQFLKYSQMDSQGRNVFETARQQALNQALQAGLSYEAAMAQANNQAQDIRNRWGATVMQDIRERDIAIDNDKRLSTYPRDVYGGYNAPGPEGETNYSSRYPTPSLADPEKTWWERFRAWLKARGGQGGPAYDDDYGKGGPAYSSGEAIYPEPPGQMTIIGQRPTSSPGDSYSTEAAARVSPAPAGFELDEEHRAEEEQKWREEEMEAQYGKLQNARDILSNLNRGQQYISAANTAYEKKGRERDEATRDLAVMGAKDIASRGLKALVDKGTISSGMGKVVGPSAMVGIDTARIMSGRGSEKDKAKAIGRSATTAGTAALTTAALTGGMGPMAPVVGSAAGDAVGRIYDYILE